MLSTKVVILLLLATFALADINRLFENVLQGKEALTDAHIDQMYEQFLEQYSDASGQTPSSTFSCNSPDDRKRIFAQRVSDIIKHNTDPSYKYKKGINSYTDMTDEEFNQYFNIVKSPQQCSATEHKASLLEKRFQL